MDENERLKERLNESVGDEDVGIKVECVVERPEQPSYRDLDQAFTFASTTIPITCASIL